MERIKTLLEWVRENPVDDKYFWKEDRRNFVLLMWKIRSRFRLTDEDVLCIGDHTSKSVLFPDVQINYKGKQYKIDYNTYFFRLTVDDITEEIYGYYEFYHILVGKMEKL